MPPITMEMLVSGDHHQNTGAEKEEKMKEVKDNFHSIKDDLSMLKKLEENNCQKILLKGQLSLIEDF